MAELFSIIGFTVLCAGLSTLCIMLAGVPLAYALARFDFAGKSFVSTLVGLPLVLPPTAVGYMLLRLFADDGVLGAERLGFDPGILLSWRGVVLACSVMSAPLVVRAARLSFESVDPGLEDMARTLGCGRLRTFLRVTLPLAAKGLVAAAILGFTRAMGEFGATIIVAGSIPGSTRTLATAIYKAQQSGDDAAASVLLWVAVGVGFFAVMLSEWLVRPHCELKLKGGGG